MMTGVQRRGGGHRGQLDSFTHPANSAVESAGCGFGSASVSQIRTVPAQTQRASAESLSLSEHARLSPIHLPPRHFCRCRRNICARLLPTPDRPTCLHPENTSGSRAQKTINALDDGPDRNQTDKTQIF